MMPAHASSLTVPRTHLSLPIPPPTTYTHLPPPQVHWTLPRKPNFSHLHAPAHAACPPTHAPPSPPSPPGYIGPYPPHLTSPTCTCPCAPPPLLPPPPPGALVPTQLNLTLVAITPGSCTGVAGRVTYADPASCPTLQGDLVLTDQADQTGAAVGWGHAHVLIVRVHVDIHLWL